tara:strand:- start:979 stop:1140 length:162 start_codon:yes stop_codon:yes gene_type:complete
MVYGELNELLILNDEMIKNLTRQNELLKEKLKLEQEENYRYRQMLMDQDEVRF